MFFMSHITRSLMRSNSAALEAVYVQGFRVWP